TFVPIAANRRIALTFREEALFSPTPFARFLQRADPSGNYRAIGASGYRPPSALEESQGQTDPAQIEYSRRHWSQYTHVLWRRDPAGAREVPRAGAPGDARARSDLALRAARPLEPPDRVAGWCRRGRCPGAARFLGGTGAGGPAPDRMAGGGPGLERLALRPPSLGADFSLDPSEELSSERESGTLSVSAELSRRGGTLERLLPGALFVLLLLAVYADPVFLRRNFAGRDPVLFHYPLEKAVHDAYARGR